MQPSIQMEGEEMAVYILKTVVQRGQLPWRAKADPQSL